MGDDLQRFTDNKMDEQEYLRKMDEINPLFLKQLAADLECTALFKEVFLRAAAKIQWQSDRINALTGARKTDG